ncbi:MAG: site-specific integrase [Actinomycetota bacterium]|nr:site-specific integrase [Actinomycetota bacterium]
MGRRAKGEGSITRRSDGRWQGRYEVNGKRKYLYGKTRSEVSVKLREALSKVAHGLIYDDQNLTLEQHLRAWLNNSKKSVRIVTFERYEQIVHNHLIPELGGVKLKNLSPMMVQDLYRKKLEELSPRTVRYIHVTLHRGLEQALKWNLIPKNVTDLVDPPKVVKEEIRPLNVEEVRRLFDTVSGHPLEAVYILAVTAGLRRGEILGLHWQDVDLDTGSLQVKRNLSFTKEGRYSFLQRPLRVGGR